MPFHHYAAIRNRIQKALRIVPHGVQSNSKPQVPGAADRQAKEEADQYGRQTTRPRLLGISQVTGSEDDREQDGRGPETHACGQSMEGITAHEKFFEQGYEEKGNRPQGGITSQSGASQGDGSEREGVSSPNCQQ